MCSEQDFQLLPSYTASFLFLPYKLDPLNPPFSFFPTKLFSQLTSFLALDFVTE